MRYTDLYEESQEGKEKEAFRDPQSDKNLSKQISDTRRPRLTLRHLNKLKKLRAVRKLENLRRDDLLQTMYGQDGGGQDMGGMGGGTGF